MTAQNEPVTEQAGPTSDLTELIERMNEIRCVVNRADGVGLSAHISGAERDEIVIALRVLRVMRNGNTISIANTEQGAFYVTMWIDEIGETEKILDEAERILGIGGHND